MGDPRKVVLKGIFMVPPRSSSTPPQVPPAHTSPNASASDGHFKPLGSHIGEMVWLMGQSPIHRELRIKDLDWLLMPPIVLQQYKLFFNDNKTPIGAALWAYLSPEAEAKFKTHGKIVGEDWGNNAQVDPVKGLVRQEGGTLWLIELIAPFHTSDNKHREQMIQDLMSTVLKGRQLNIAHINVETNRKEMIVLG